MNVKIVVTVEDQESYELERQFLWNCRSESELYGALLRTGLGMREAGRMVKTVFGEKDAETKEETKDTNSS